jgi:hypothetical protein
MNYFSRDEDIKQSVLKLLGGGFSKKIERVNFGVAYSQNRKLSVIIIEVAPSSIIHSIVLFYTKGVVLYDAVTFKNKRFFRIVRGTKAFGQVEKISEMLLKEIPKSNPYMARELDEEVDLDSRLQMKNAQIQHLKDRLRIEAGKNQNLRNQIKVLKHRS